MEMGKDKQPAARAFLVRCSAQSPRYYYDAVKEKGEGDFVGLDTLREQHENAHIHLAPADEGASLGAVWDDIAFDLVKLGCKPVTFLDTYYDTADLRLAKHGLWYSVRSHEPRLKVVEKRGSATRYNVVSGKDEIHRRVKGVLGEDWRSSLRKIAVIPTRRFPVVDGAVIDCSKMPDNKFYTVMRVNLSRLPVMARGEDEDRNRLLALLFARLELSNSRVAEWLATAGKGLNDEGDIAFAPPRAHTDEMPEALRRVQHVSLEPVRQATSAERSSESQSPRLKPHQEKELRPTPAHDRDYVHTLVKETGKICVSDFQAACREHKGQCGVFANGQLVGVRASYDEARALAEQQEYASPVVLHLVDRSPVPVQAAVPCTTNHSSWFDHPVPSTLTVGVQMELVWQNILPLSQGPCCC